MSNCTAFAGPRKIASGDVIQVALKVKRHQEKDGNAAILIFDDLTSRQVELDLRGTADAIIKRLQLASRVTEAAAEMGEDKKVGPGRPKLGVVSREISLLPRHWEWLAQQPGGASVTLRKLVEEAKKKNQGKDEFRQAQEVAYKFMSVMAGDLLGFEEALRAFYAKDALKFEKLIAPWPKDIRAHVLKLAINALERK